VAASDNLDAPVRSVDDLLAPFHDAEKPPSAFRVGTEAEKFGVYSDTFAPVAYEGERGIKAVLARLGERFGWAPEAEYDAGPIVALKRGAASITLEPGGQLELSGAPFVTVHETAAEMKEHIAEIRAVGDELGIAWLGLGFQPFATQAELPWVPKLRYSVMRDYLPTRGSMALDMMRRTSTVQANLDYSSEEDAMRKLDASLRLQPIFTAMFANSPFYEGAPAGRLDQRALVWLHMDPDRSGLLPFVFEERPSYLRYVEWALDVPMFIVKRGSQVLDNTGQTFRQFMAEGTRGEVATHRDWETHLNTLFPEVRLKRTLEVRGADSQQGPLIPAVTALWKGLLYDERSLAAASELGARFGYEALEHARADIATRALGAKIGDEPVIRIAERMLEIARDGLTRIGARDAEGHDETEYLVPLEALVAQGLSPAEALLGRVAERGAEASARAIVAEAQV
jgi:glutamate--cysteine ligase